MSELAVGDTVTITGFKVASAQQFEGDTQYTRNSREAVGVSTVYISSPKYRKVLYLRNSSPAAQEITIHFGTGAVTLKEGIILKAGEWYIEASDNGFEAFSGTITAISDLAGGYLTIMER